MGKVKNIIALALAVLMAAYFTGCGGTKAGVGPRVMHNVARFYSPAERQSVFAIDGKRVDGSVTGRAEMTNSARGDTSLAWVDSTLYFVSEKGIDALWSSGQFGADLARGAGAIGTCFESVEALIAALPTLVRKGDAILVKASRGARFERVSEALKELKL